MLEDGWRSYGCCRGCGQLVTTLFSVDQVDARTTTCPTCGTSLADGLDWVSSARFFYGSKNEPCVACGAALPPAASCCRTCGLSRDGSKVELERVFQTCACPACAQPIAATAIRCPHCATSFGPPIARIDDDDPGRIVIACPSCAGFWCELRSPEDEPRIPQLCPYCGSPSGNDAALEYERDAFVRNCGDGRRCPSCTSEVRDLAVVCGACRKRLSRPKSEPEAEPTGQVERSRAPSRRPKSVRIGLVVLVVLVGLVGSFAAVDVFVLRESRQRREEQERTRQAILARVAAAKAIPWDARFVDAPHRLPADVVVDDSAGGVANTLLVTYDDRQFRQTESSDDISPEARVIWDCEAFATGPATGPASSAVSVRPRLAELCATAKYVLGVRLEMEVPKAERPGFTMNHKSRDWTVSKWTYRGVLVLARIEPGKTPAAALVARRWLQFDVPNHEGTRQQALYRQLQRELSYWKDRAPDPCGEILHENLPGAVERCVDLGNQR